ncbi:MAG TPA: FRG domain-containing protein [Sphingomicrobium sp.]|nr:FRG domain-containing protein [Sphingomicrobium sp.]
MEIIGDQKIWTFKDGVPAIFQSTCADVRRSDAFHVRNYLDLATKVADLQFHNRDHVLMFRGQGREFKNDKRNTSLKPSILRSLSGSKAVPSLDAIGQRFRKLKLAEAALVQTYRMRGFRGIQRLERQQILRWSILQHYEICPTPLLDVTHSLRVAASFASEGADDSAYIFVLGVPQVSGAITASAEAGLQVVRLSSVCPPSAVRPHLQEGYLIGEYPDFSSVDQKQLYPHFEMDFGRRLVAKFRFDPRAFWGKSKGFPKIPRNALYPLPKSDPMCELAGAVKIATSP